MPQAPVIAEIEFQSFQLVNQARSEHGVQPQLSFSDALVAVARAHSEAMRDQQFFGHDGPDGGLEARLRQAGISYGAAGENLARVSAAGDVAGAAHGQFMSSAQHRRILLNDGFELVGVGVARSGDDYWLTQIFIRP